jgi:gamma-glutamyltranspeptidase/glutathione hydrolase
MVVSAYPEASRAGQAVLQQGGNAVDAAIATGFALAVTHPAAGNIGGGGFMVIRFPDGRSTAFNFREKAPLRAHPEMFLDEAGKYSPQLHHHSHRAVGVPGTVAGFVLAHQRYGTAEWKQLVQPAVELAEQGFVISPQLAGSLREMLPEFRKYPATLAQFSRNGEPYRAGETLVQGDLARTLQRIRDDGHAGFYAGETARLLVEEMEQHGGWITHADLQRYQAVEQQPVFGAYRGYDIISMSPPSSGGIALLQMLNILEGYDLRAWGKESPQTLHVLAEAMRRAYRDRARWLADPGFAQVPVAQLTSKGYAAELREGINLQQAGISAPTDVELPSESEETTHYSVVDGAGMAVAVTYTLEFSYGSYITVPGAGFLLNNEMGDFNPQPGLTTREGLIGTEPNLARPEQRMLSSMTPTIIARDGKLVAVLGSPGGRTIINTVLNLVVNTIDFEMTPAAAVAAPRTHHQWLPDTLLLEGELFTSPAAAELQQWGHRVQRRNRQGVAHVIFVDPEGMLVGVPDPRDRDGAAAGVDDASE